MVKKNLRKLVYSILLVVVITLGLIITLNEIEDNKNSEISIETLSKYGSRGDEVRTIQTKLKRWGYYTGNIDGIYGSKTVEAVKYFQRKNNLAVDGIAGTNTLKAMGIFNSSGNSRRKWRAATLHKLTFLLNLFTQSQEVNHILGKLRLARSV